MKRILTLAVFMSGAILAQTPAVSGFFNNYGGNIPIAQGSIIAITGSNLSSATTELQNAPLQTTLQGVRIRFTVNTVVTYAPIYYVTPGQLAGIVPSATPTGTGNIVIERNGVNSAPFAITIVRSAFGTLYTAGTSNARVHDSQYRELSPSNATNPGQYLIFYGSGVGPTTKDETVSQTGANASGDLTSVATVVTIGGKAANVLYRGRTEFPGLDQINVQVPTLDAYSCSVSVTVTTNGVPGNATTIPVAASGSTCTNPSGGGNQTSLTQDEINTFAARGSYTGGQLGLTRSTIYSSAGVTKTDVVSGQFNRVSGSDLPKMLRGEYPPGFVNTTPAIDGCLVLNAAQYTSNPWPALTYQNLDGGAQLTSDGPNGTQAILRGDHQVAGPTYSTPTLPQTYISPGRYTLRGTGGSQVGAFSGTVDVATELVVTNSTAELQTINRNNPFTVRWTGGAPETYLTILGTSFSLNGSALSGSAFVCIIKTSHGSFTIPADILRQIPASVPGSALSGQFSVTARGEGARVIPPPSGLDVMTLNNFWAWQWATVWQ